jgi:hypothetical protein
LTHSRIIFGDLPRLTRDVIEGTLAHEEDMQIVGYSTDADLERHVEETHADVAIVHERGGDLALRLICRYPRLRIVAITGAGDTASVYEFRIVRLADLSAAALLDAIRGPNAQAGGSQLR